MAAAATRVMHNDFVLVGPADDPADVKGSATAADAMAKIAASESTFVSRADESGTNTKELELWDEAGVSPAVTGTRRPGRAWARP